MPQSKPTDLIIVFIGPPGAGKGSQSRLLAQAWDKPCLSIGALLREMSNQGTPVAKKVRDRLATGQLMENELLAEVIRNRTSEIDCMGGYVIDGYPRNPAQAYWLEQWSSLQIKQIAAVHLSVSHEIARIRVLGRRTCSTCGEEFNTVTKPPNLISICDSCGAPLVSRNDARIIEQRLTVYESETLPLLNYYESSGRLISLNAESPEMDVFNMLLKDLGRRADRALWSANRATEDPQE